MSVVFSFYDPSEIAPETVRAVSEFLETHADFGYDEELACLVGTKEDEIVFACQIFDEVDYLVAIYSVCTHTQHRKRGIMREAFEWIETHYSNVTLWIGMEFNQPYSYVEMYGRLGFRHPYYTKSAPKYGDLGRKVIAMTKNLSTC